MTTPSNRLETLSVPLAPGAELIGDPSSLSVNANNSLLGGTSSTGVSNGRRRMYSANSLFDYTDETQELNFLIATDKVDRLIRFLRLHVTSRTGTVSKRLPPWDIWLVRKHNVFD